MNVTRFFCRLNYRGDDLEDLNGFEASDASEALDIARAIACALLKHDPARQSEILTLLENSGTAIHSATLTDWSKALQ